jgi:PAS domain S-box-containing protein
VEMSTDSIVVSDIDARIIDVNEATLKMYGTGNREELIGKSAFDLLAPEDREKALAGMKEALEKGYVKGEEYDVITKDGDRIPVEMSSAIMKDADGKPIGFVGISRDITERKQMEESIRRRNAELAALNAIAIAVSQSLDLDEILNDTLDKTLEVLEIEAGCILIVDEKADGLTLIAHRGISEQFAKTLSSRKIGEGASGRVAQSGEPLILEDIPSDQRASVAAKREGLMSFAAVPLKSKAKVLGVLDLATRGQYRFTSQDIDLLTSIGSEIGVAIENAELYDSILRYKNQLRAVVRSMAEGIVVTDSENRITRMNPAAQELVGFKLEDVLGEDADSSLAVERKDIEEIEREEASGEVVAPLTRQVGDRVLSINVRPIETDDAQRLGTVYAIRDITELAKVDQMKTEFVSMVSHELRTPLTSIKGYLDLVLDGEAGEINEMQREFLGVVQSNTDRLVVLINDLLDISRIESGRLQLSIAVLPINQIIEEVVASLRTQIEEKRLSLELNLPEELARVKGDRDRVIQVLTNLLSNAYKFTPEGGRITVSARRTDGQVQVDVADTGIGISPRDQQKLFTKFFRADSSMTREAGGTGLGLTIAKSIVEMHGGRIWFGSEVGKGSTFSFTLPAVVPSKGEGPVA